MVEFVLFCLVLLTNTSRTRSKYSIISSKISFYNLNVTSTHANCKSMFIAPNRRQNLFCMPNSGILCLNRMRTVMSTSKVFIVHSYPRDRLSNETDCNLRILRAYVNKKLSYRRGTARCVVSIEILPIATQQSRNYLYDKS